jgi:hypothetical protein
VLDQQVLLSHKVEVIDESSEVDVSPGEFLECKMTVVCFGNGFEFVEIERNCLGVEELVFGLAEGLVGLVLSCTEFWNLFIILLILLIEETVIKKL